MTYIIYHPGGIYASNFYPGSLTMSDDLARTWTNLKEARAYLAQFADCEMRGFEVVAGDLVMHWGRPRWAIQAVMEV